MTAAAPSYLYRPCIKPTTGLAILWGIPPHVRKLIRAGVPQDWCHYGTSTEGLLIGVGSGCPIRWLTVQADDAGELEANLYEVRRAVKNVAHERCKPAELPALLTKWASQFSLST